MSDPPERATWTKVAFGDVVNHIKDRVPDVTNCGLNEYIRGEHFEPGNLRLIGRSILGDGKHGSAFCMRFRPGDVLYVSRNPQLRKAAVADFEGICANTTYVCRSNEQYLLQDLLPFIMQTESFVDYTILHKRGSTNFYLNWSDIAGYEFPLPPLEEQRRICTFFAAIDEASEALQRSFLRLQQVEGSLLDVHQHFDRDLRAPRLSLEQEKGEWCLVPVKDVIEDMTYGLTVRPDYHVTGIPLVSANEVSDGVIHFESAKKISSKDAAETRDRAKPESGDVLVTKTGTIGRIAVVSDRDLPFVLAQNVAILKPDRSMILPSYLGCALSSTAAQTQMYSRVTTQTVSDLQLGELGQVIIAVAPLTQQTTYLTLYDDVRSSKTRIQERMASQKSLRERAIAKALKEEIA